MSFQNKNFWMPRYAGSLTDGDTRYDNSPTIEPKHPHNWLMDELELFSHKRQEMEGFSSRPKSGVSNGSISLWDDSPNFQTVSGQFSDHLFGSETVRSSNVIDRRMPTADMGNLNSELRGFKDQLGIHSSVNLSMARTIEDSSLGINYGGIRRVKVNVVGPSENGKPVSIGHPYSRMDNNMYIGAAYNEIDNNISLGPTYDRGKEIAISLDPTFPKPNENFISTGHTFNKGDGSFMLMGHSIYRGYDNSLCMSQSLDKGDGAFVSMGHGYEKGNASIVSAGHAYNMGHGNFTSMLSTYEKDNGNFISVGPSQDKGAENSILMRPTSVKASTYVLPMNTTEKKGNSGNPSMVENYEKGGTDTFSLGDFRNEPETNPSGGMTNGYDLVANEPSVQTSKAPSLEISTENEMVAPAATAKTKATLKIKEPKSTKKVAAKATLKIKEPKSAKKVPAQATLKIKEPKPSKKGENKNNNFPANVKSLLSTGMLDGVPVKYVSWSREHSLKGIVKGTGFLCGCKDCKFSKSLNSYELEQHAGCKTKHPNDHIYFQNGKTIYAVVQELRSTPQEMLFETIQTITGSPINEKNFCSWKASYEAATRELQRIFGKDKLIIEA